MTQTIQIVNIGVRTLRVNVDYRSVTTHFPINSDRECKQIIFCAIFCVKLILSLTITQLMETICIHMLYLIIIINIIL